MTTAGCRRRRGKALAKRGREQVVAPRTPRTEAEEQLVAEWNRRKDERLNEPPGFTLERLESEWKLDAPNSADREVWKAKLAQALGGTSRAAQVTLISQLVMIVVNPRQADALALQSLNGAIALLDGIAPQDTIETILATQIVAAQKVAMDQLRLATVPGQAPELVTNQLNRAGRMMRLFLFADGCSTTVPWKRTIRAACPSRARHC